MRKLVPPNTHHLSAAVGWLELKNPAEAKAELARITPAARKHPDVLEVEWIICVGQGDWERGLDVARGLLRADPKRVTGWLHQAYALRRVQGGGVKQALDALAPAADKFPAEPTVFYNLACYTCQLRQFDVARIWFRQALRAGGKGQMCEMALNDSDLEPLWEEIRGM